jgi:ribosomal protein S6--L-glutamate ligase
MKLITFNPYRTLGIPNVEYIKPQHMFKEIQKIKEADVILFPEYWQVNSLVYGLKKAIFPSIESIHLGHTKVEMTRALWSVCPKFVPYTEILASSEENERAILDIFSFPFVAKEIKNSMGNGVFLIENRTQFSEYAARNDILYVQEYLESDRDLRVCLVGDEVVTSYWRVGASGQFHHNVARGGSIVQEMIPEQAIDVVKKVAGELNINHAGFDILLTDGVPYILEFNILFGNQGITQQGISIENKIYEYLLNQFGRPFPTAPLTPQEGQRIS